MMIADKYRVERELGRGGFGIVVSALHLQLDQKVAIKILTAGEGGDAGWKEDAARFHREGQATAALRSPHVVRILDVDVLESGNPYMVMEYLEGETLHTLLHTRALTVGEAVDHIVEVLAALAEAHAAGIVHRDLKPANVFVTKGAGGIPVVKVLDFGVSKFGAHSAIGGVAPLTKTGALIGTIAYMAPEQMVDAKRVDGRADLWSVGIILHELLTKQTPFGPQNATTLVTTMLTKPPIALSTQRPDAPPQLDAILARCLEKLPEKRFATAGAVAAKLAPFTTPRARAALDSLGRTGRPTGAAAPIEKGMPKIILGAAAVGAPRRNRTRTVLAIALVLATVALLGVLLGMVVGRRRVAPTIAPSASAN
jgi:eukaryotic-like serine/threonine-protein kinase